MSLALNGTNGVTYNDGTQQSSAPGGKNLIINGNMQIAQRGTSVTGITATGYYTVDRYQTAIANSAGTWTMTQDTDVPTGQGFASSLKFLCTTAKAILDANSVFFQRQMIEGFNVQQLGYGTANAKSVTLSFWVKSNKTGTYIAELFKDDDSRTISQAYTISVADTWEKKTMTYVGDTTGTITNDNTSGLRVQLWVATGSDFSSGTLQTSWGSIVQANRGVGQVNLADTVNNYINITGIQLEVGDTATDFEFLPYDVQLQRCQRYYYVLAEGDNQAIAVGYYYNATQLGVVGTHPVQMRATPTVDQTTGTNYYSISRNNTNDPFNSFSVAGATNNKNYYIFNNTQASGIAGQAGLVYNYTASGGNAYVALSAEL